MSTKYYYYINHKKSISKVKWISSKKDWERLDKDNYFESFQEAFEELNK